MKKIFTLLIAGLALTANVNAQDWNFSSADFNALGTIGATTTVQGLTIYSIVDTSVTVDANNKTEGGVSYTYRLKLGGTGNFNAEGKPVSRVLTFPVTGNVQITVKAMASSSSATDRTLNVKAASGEVIGAFNVLGSTLSAQTYNYTGGANTIYVYSINSGINLYHLMVTGVGATNIKNTEVNAKIVKTIYYGLSGKIVGDRYATLKKGAYIQKTIYDNGESVISKFVKAFE